MARVHKRATVYFDADLHRALRVKAAETDRSMSDLVNEAVKQTLAEDAEDLAAFEQRATSLRLELVPGLSERDPVIVQSELVAVEREIESLNRQLIAIPTEDPLELADRDLQIKAVSRRIQLLELQYYWPRVY